MKLKAVSSKKLIKILGIVDYSVVRQEGSHCILEHQKTRKITVVPIHSGQKIGVGLLSMILRETEVSREEYLKLLEKT